MTDHLKALDEIERIAGLVDSVEYYTAESAMGDLQAIRMLARNLKATLRAALAPVPDEEVEAIKQDAARFQLEIDTASSQGIGHPKFDGQSKLLRMIATLLRKLSERDGAEGKVEALREALKPFAEFAEALNHGNNLNIPSKAIPDEAPVYGYNLTILYRGDFRRAAQTLKDTQ